jgi:ATP-binding cassette subfamily C (CFTR/MRP) protein 1
MLLCQNDASFGPGSTCRELDFTVSFQSSYVKLLENRRTSLPHLTHRILSILPDSIFLCCTIWRFLWLWRQPTKLARLGWTLLGAKLLLASLIIASNAGVVAFQFLRLKDQEWPVIGLAASLLSLVASVSLTQHDAPLILDPTFCSDTSRRPRGL